MSRSPLAVWFLLITSAFCQSQGNTPPPQTPAQKPAPMILTWTPPEHPMPPFGSVIRKAVSVVREKCRDDNGAIWDASGTGFIVAYHDPRLTQADVMFDYLVTNRHVAECMNDELRPREVLSVGIEVNTKNGQDAIFPLNAHGNVAWRFPADTSVDLAVIPILPAGDFVPTVVPLDMFFSKEDFATQNMGEGTKIILSGYFYQLDGATKLEPLVREGVLSLIPDAPLNTALRKPGTVYLGEVHVFGGNSGSPVFISMEGTRPSGIMLDGNYRFLGVVSGYYYEDSDFKLQIATTVTGKQHANSGITMIVPADFLKDLILKDSELTRIRDSNFPVAQAK
jgi:hypothetical protein